MAAGESRDRSERERDRNGNHYFLDGKVLTSRKSCDEDIGRTRGEEPEVKRPRPKSAPALRRRMTPQTITLPTFQVSAFKATNINSRRAYPAPIYGGLIRSLSDKDMRT